MELKTATPASQGVPAEAIIDLINAYEGKKVYFHGIMILRHGKVVAQGYKKPYRAEYPHVLFSLSKSFTSTAIGFAVQEGLISVEDYVTSFFPEKFTCKPCENMQRMKIKHLLTMSTGHSVEPPMRGANSEWLDLFLKSYVDTNPPGRFVYNTPATYTLSAILQKVTGVTTLEYLTPRLFEPLGIENARWEKSPEGITTGGWGLNLKVEDIAKFGLFLQNRGVVDGKQLLNSEWIDTATSKLVENFGDKDWGYGYGYQFWQCNNNKAYRGDGAFGQYCYVDNENDLVIAITGGMDNLQHPLDCIYENLLPALKDEAIAETTEEKATQEKLLKLLGSLSFDTARGEKALPEDICFAKAFDISQNILDITELEFCMKNDELLLTITEVAKDFEDGEGRKCEIRLGYNEFLDSDTYVDLEEIHIWNHSGLFEKVSGSYGFEGNCLNIKLFYPTTPFCDDIKVIFDDGFIKLSLKRDRGMNPISFEAFGIEKK